MKFEHFNPKEIQKGSRFEKITNLSNVPLHKRTFDEKEKIAGETFSFFKEFLTQNGFTEYKDINEAYKNIPQTQYIVRREDPKKIFTLLEEDGQSYEIGFEDDRYSNCALWNPATDGVRGIYNAYMEGMTNLNGIVTVIGLIPHKEDDLIQMEDATQNFYGLDRANVRSYKGKVSKDQVAFINLRVPGHLLPESELTEDELDRVYEYMEKIENEEVANPVMIHRSYVAEHI